MLSGVYKHGRDFGVKTVIFELGRSKGRRYNGT